MNKSALLDILFFNGAGETDDQVELAALMRRVENEAINRGVTTAPILTNRRGSIGAVVYTVGPGAEVDRVSVSVSTGDKSGEESEALLTSGLLAALMALQPEENGVQ